MATDFFVGSKQKFDDAKLLNVAEESSDRHVQRVFMFEQLIAEIFQKSVSIVLAYAGKKLTNSTDYNRF